MLKDILNEFDLEGIKLDFDWSICRSKIDQWNIWEREKNHPSIV